MPTIDKDSVAFNSKLIGALLLPAATLFIGCSGALLPQGQADREDQAAATASLNGLFSVNGLSSVNGLTAVNGLMSVNGLSSVNGLFSVNGLADGNIPSGSRGLMTTAAGRNTVSYLVRCALPAGHSITKKDQSGASYTFSGAIGMAPEWETGACGADCQQQMSACMMAHVNTSGVHIPLWLDGDSPALGWGQSQKYPFQEGSFFGNIFTTPPQAFYCEGSNFGDGVVRGRIGADQASAPYANKFGTDGTCAQNCTAADSPNQNDGYKACAGFKHVVTVWRDFLSTEWYKICNSKGGTCLSVDNNSNSTGARIEGDAFANHYYQMFNLTNVGGTYQLTVMNSQQSLEARGSSLAAGAVVQQNKYAAKSTQNWNIVPYGTATGLYQVVNNATASTSTPMCMTLDNGGASANGTSVVQQPCSASADRLWRITLGQGT